MFGLTFQYISCYFVYIQDISVCDKIAGYVFLCNNSFSSMVTTAPILIYQSEGLSHAHTARKKLWLIDPHKKNLTNHQNMTAQ